MRTEPPDYPSYPTPVEGGMVLENRAAPYSTKDDTDGRVHYNDFLFTVEEKLKVEVTEEDLAHYPTYKVGDVVPDSNTVLAWLSCAFFCPITGIAAVVQAKKSEKAASSGDMVSAKEYGERSFRWGVGSIIIGMCLVSSICIILLILGLAPKGK